MTISLLPDFLAARLSGTLREVEHVAAVSEHAESREAAVGQLRPADEAGAVTLPSALRWLRRRLTPVGAALLAAVTLLPELSGCAPTIGAVRARLDVAEALAELRARASSLLPSPVGLRARARKRDERRPWPPHEAGPDPPGACG